MSDDKTKVLDFETAVQSAAHAKSVAAEAMSRATKATEGPWLWWTSNSMRRLSARGDGDVAYGTVHPHDGVPDICISEEDMLFTQHARTDVPVLCNHVDVLADAVVAMAARIADLEAQIAAQPRDTGTLINRAASLGARAVTALDAARAMPGATPAQRQIRAEAFQVVAWLQAQADDAWRRVRAAVEATRAPQDAPAPQPGAATVPAQDVPAVPGGCGQWGL